MKRKKNRIREHLPGSREVRDKSLEKQVELYQREIKRLLNEKENLKMENRKLVITLNKLQKEVK